MNLLMYIRKGQETLWVLAHDSKAKLTSGSELCTHKFLLYARENFSDRANAAGKL